MQGQLLTERELKLLKLERMFGEEEQRAICDFRQARCCQSLQSRKRPEHQDGQVCEICGICAYREETSALASCRSSDAKPFRGWYRVCRVYHTRAIPLKHRRQP